MPVNLFLMLLSRGYIFNINARLVVLAALCLLCCGAGAREAGAPLVSLESLQGGYSLAGQWKFRPGDELDWALATYDDDAWSTGAVPGRWPQGGYPESNQFAWYRLTLRFDLQNLQDRQRLAQLAVRLGKVLSAYELYAGGKLLGGVGKLPPLGEVNYDRERAFLIPPSAIDAEGTLVLALRVWGGDAAALTFWRAGPYGGEFILGEYRSLLLSGVIAELPGLLVSVLVVGFGLYHLYLYRRNRQLDTYLWFGLLALNIGIYSLMLMQWKYMFDWPFLTLKKIEFGAIYLFPAVAIQTVWCLLGRPIGLLLRAYQLSFVASSIVVVAVPGHFIHYQTQAYWQLWAVPILLWVPWLIVREAQSGNREARTLAVGTLVFIAACINDLLIDLAGLQNNRLVPYGFAAIMVAMSVSLANRFTTMLNGLEDEVATRTAELSLANEQLAEAARIDPLTGLLNRRGFGASAEAEIQRVFRSDRGFALILADIDSFKTFNDRYGHACGDHVLKRAAAIFSANLRDVDRVARWGGEEFIILLPETGLDGAAVLAEKMRQCIADNMFEFDGQRLSITMTFGIAGHRKGETLDACIARADTALYHGKEMGRNKVMIGSYKGLTLVS